MKRQLIKLSAAIALFGSAAAAQAAGLTVVADTIAFLGAIDLDDTRTILLSVGAGLAVLAALSLAIRKGLRMIGF